MREFIGSAHDVQLFQVTEGPARSVSITLAKIDLQTPSEYPSLPYCMTMTSRSFIVAAAAVLLAACSSSSDHPDAEPPQKKVTEAPKPPDESRYLPRTNQISTEVVADHLLGKTFMPGGTLGHYKNGKSEYEMFVRKLAAPLDAALLLPEWQKELKGSKLVPAFGAYAGDDAGRPVFVFTKGAWIAGIAGLTEKQADLPARALATLLN